MALDRMAATADMPAEHAVSIAPTTSSSHSRTLPNEVLSMIASECDPIDLKNMRLASKLMRQVSTESFARKKFSRRRFLFTYQSMKALVDITAHPDFGPHLTCLTFGTYRMDKSPRFDLKYNDRVVLYQLNEAMHRAFIDNEYHVKMLVTALENLQRCRNINVDLGIYDDIHLGELRRRGLAFEASYQDFHAHQADASGTLWAVISAIEKSKYSLAALKLCLSQDSFTLTRLLLEKTYAVEKFLPCTSFPHRIFADIQINVWQRRGSFAKLKLLSNLARLELTRHAVALVPEDTWLMRFDEFVYGAVWRAIKSSRLQSIAIERSEVEFGEFERILQTHSRSLISLELRCISTRPFGPGYETTLTFLRFLRHKLNLNYLCIEDFYMEDYQTGQETDLIASDKVVCNGEREIVEGLDKLIQELRDKIIEL